MFTGIIQGIALINKVIEKDQVKTFEIIFPKGFCKDLQQGASISIDGVCLTVTNIIDDITVHFDVVLQTLNVTTLGSFKANQKVNAERASKQGDEIGGHPLSGHIDFKCKLQNIEKFGNNQKFSFEIAHNWSKYIFSKGFIAINGTSLTVSEIDKIANVFEVWLIPETLSETTFSEKEIGQNLNIEIDRNTQIMVDTINAAIDEKLKNFNQ